MALIMLLDDCRGLVLRICLRLEAGTHTVLCRYQILDERLLRVASLHPGPEKGLALLAGNPGIAL